MCRRILDGGMIGKADPGKVLTNQWANQPGLDLDWRFWLDDRFSGQ